MLIPISSQSDWNANLKVIKIKKKSSHRSLLRTAPQQRLEHRSTPGAAHIGAPGARHATPRLCAHYIEDSNMLSIHFDIPNKLLLAKLRDKLLIMFDKFVINFKSTKFYVPDKDLSIIGLTNPYNSGFKVGEHVKEKFWGKSLENQLNFLFNLDEFTAFVMMKEFFFQHGTMMSTTIADKPRCYMYNNVYWEELTTNLSEIRGNKFDVMYQWLFKEWNLIQKEEFSYLDNAIIDTFQVSSDKDIRMIKSKIDTNIRNLHDGCSRKNPYLHNKDFGVANPSTI